MIKRITIFLLLSLLLGKSFSQSKKEVDSLLSEVNEIENSKYIASSEAAKKIIAYGDKALPLLASFFRDSIITNVKSDCQSVLLTKGEVAIIIADRIELMPYALLTGIQNCLLTFCENNPNLIEYYLDAIRRNGVQLFERKYSDWLISDDRRKWAPYSINKKKKKQSQ
jgi:hypothetical protein